jgi:hypothetical protein
LANGVEVLLRWPIIIVEVLRLPLPTKLCDVEPLQLLVEVLRLPFPTKLCDLSIGVIGVEPSGSVSGGLTS